MSRELGDRPSIDNNIDRHSLHKLREVPHSWCHDRSCKRKARNNRELRPAQWETERQALEGSPVPASALVLQLERKKPRRSRLEGRRELPSNASNLPLARAVLPKRDCNRCKSGGANITRPICSGRPGKFRRGQIREVRSLGNLQRERTARRASGAIALLAGQFRRPILSIEGGALWPKTRPLTGANVWRGGRSAMAIAGPVDRLP